MKRLVNLKIEPKELREIDRTADQAGLTRTGLFLLGVRALVPEIMEHDVKASRIGDGQ